MARGVASGRPALPIDGALPAIVEAVQVGGSLVLVAEPGAGKTTRVPPALMEALPVGEIIVLQPRRIAARMAARRVAAELGEKVGQRVGYRVRFEDVGGKDTRIVFVTEAILTRRLLRDPELKGVAAVVLDEFHERSLHADLALALCHRLRRGARPDLRVLVMSATLSAEPVAAFLGCEVQRVEGRAYDVDVAYDAHADDRPLDRRVASAFSSLLDDGLDGDVLVFLPGAGEIRRAQERCEGIAKRAGVEVHALHGDLQAAAQDRAVASGTARKLILSTNIAETSLTIPGVVAVVDSGVARVAGHSPFSGLPTLQTRPISRASATQRAGRAGRVRAGRCLRLYTRHDFDTRPAQDPPEIARSDLAETLLLLAAMGIELSREQFFEAPAEGAVDSARALLQQLGALDAGGALTPRGQRMAGMPLHPRLSRIVIEAEARGVGDDGCLLAALLSERDVSLLARARFGDAGGQRGARETGPSDLLQRLDAVRSVQDGGGSASSARAHGLDAGGVRAALQTAKRLRRFLREDAPLKVADDESLLMALLSGFGDRVAKRAQRGEPGVRGGRQAGQRHDRERTGELLVFAHGGSATQAPESVVRDAQLVVVLDAAEQSGRRRGVVARQLSAIEPEWLLELFPDAVEDHLETRFDATSECVETRTGLSYGSIVLDESLRRDVSGPQVEATLAAAAREHGLSKLFDLDAADAELRRWRFAASAAPVDGAMPPCPQDALALAVDSACAGGRSFADLRRQVLADHVRGLLPPDALARLSHLARSQVQLPGGRKLTVNYEPDRPPWVQSRLQDFFGMADGPRLGSEPLVLHLLAPNRRAVQVTTDLAGFWQRHYPEQRKQLMRRYPRHDWPEDPLSAKPPSPTSRPRRRKR